MLNKAFRDNKNELGTHRNLDQSRCMLFFLHDRIGVMGHSKGSVLESFLSVMSCSFIVHSLDSDRGPFVVKTDWNWELSRFAFAWVSVISLSLCLSGGHTPHSYTVSPRANF